MHDEVTALAEFAGVEDGLPEWGMTIVGYMDTEGNSRFQTRLYGAHSPPMLVGILEVVKQELIFSYMTDESEDEPEGDD
jgi:hypothetical protein